MKNVITTLVIGILSFAVAPPPAPAPSPVAQSTASALEITGANAAGIANPLSRKKGYGRKQFRTDLPAGSGLNIPA